MKTIITENEMELEFCRLVNLLPSNAAAKILLNCQITKKYDINNMLKFTINLADFFNIKSKLNLI